MLVLNSKDRRSMFPEEKADAPFSFFRKLAGFILAGLMLIFFSHVNIIMFHYS